MGDGRKLGAFNLRQMHRQRDPFRADPATGRQRNRLAPHNRCGHFRTQIDHIREAPLRGDILLRNERGRALVVQDLTIDQDARRAAIDQDRACLVVEEVDLDHPIGFDRMRMGREAANRPLILIGIGFLTIPGAAHIVVGLLPVGRRGHHHIAGVGINLAARLGDIRERIGRDRQAVCRDIAGVEVVRVRDQGPVEDLRDRGHRNIVGAQIDDPQPALFLPPCSLTGPAGFANRPGVALTRLGGVACGGDIRGPCNRDPGQTVCGRDRDRPVQFLGVDRHDTAGFVINIDDPIPAGVGIQGLDLQDHIWQRHIVVDRDLRVGGVRENPACPGIHDIAGQRDGAAFRTHFLDDQGTRLTIIDGREVRV